MSIFRCHFCRQPVQWMNTKFAKRMLFDALPVAVGLDHDEQGWIPGQWKTGRAARTVMAPIGHYSREKRMRVQHVVFLHACVHMRQESA